MRKIFCFGVLLLSAVTFQSCLVDRKLDLDKGVDMVVTVAPGLDVPFGYAGTVRTEALLKGITWSIDHVIPFEPKPISFDENGNMVHVIDSTTFWNQKLLPGTLLDSYDVVLSAVKSFEYVAGDDRLEIPVASSAILSLSGPGLASSVDSVRNLVTKEYVQDFDMRFDVHGATGIIVRKGFRIDFPEWMTLGSLVEGKGFVLEGSHSLVVEEDLSIPSSTGKGMPLKISTTITSIPEEALPNNGSLDLTAEVAWSGTLSVEKLYSGTEGSSVDVESLILYSSPDVEIVSADVFLGEKIACDDMVIFPFLASMAKPYVYLSDLQLDLTVENRLSEQVSVSSGLQVYDSSMEMIKEYGIGQDHGQLPILVKPGSSASVFVSGSGTAPEGYIDYKLPGLADSELTKQANQFLLKGLEAKVKSSGWERTTPEEEQNFFGAHLLATAPIVLGEGIDSKVEQRLGHFGVDTVMVFDKMTPMIFEMDVESTMPLSFELRAEIVDSLGNVVPEYAPVVQGSIVSGDAENPGCSTLSVSFLTKKIVPFDGIRFTFIVDSESQNGKPLNKNQSIVFDNMRIVIPEGVTFDPAWLKYIKYLSDVMAVVRDVEEIL